MAPPPPTSQTLARLLTAAVLLGWLVITAAAPAFMPVVAQGASAIEAVLGWDELVEEPGQP